MTKRPPLDEVLALFQGIVAVPVRTTTGPGAVGGTSLVDAGLAGSGVNSYFSMCAIIYPGDPVRIASADITAFDNATGEVTFTPAYKGGQVLAGTPYMILTHRFVPAEVAALMASLGTMDAAATADDLSDVTTTPAHAKLRRLLLRMSTDAFTATIMGAARTELDTMLAQLAVYFKVAGAAFNPTIYGAARADVSDALQNLAVYFKAAAAAYSATVGGAARADVESSLTALAAYFNAASAALNVTIDNGGAARSNLNDILTDLGQMLAGAGITTWPAAAVPGDGVSFAGAIRQIYNDLFAINSGFQEQPDTAVNINAIAAGETNVLNLAAVGTRYIVRSLRLKCADPGAETCTVRLYEFINDVLTVVDTFAIDAINWATAHSLMDMWGLPHLAGDNLKVTVQMSGGPAVAVTGQYSWSSAT